MTYNSNWYVPNYSNSYFEKLHDIRNEESQTRDIKAREKMKEINQERISTNNPSPRYPVLVSRKMKHLPKADIK